MGVVVNKPLAPAAKPEGVALGEAVGDGQDGDRGAPRHTRGVRRRVADLHRR